MLFLDRQDVAALLPMTACNANFPGNPDRNGLPTVQGMVGLFDAADIRPGQFIAAIGAHSAGKQELDPRVLAMARVVTDLTGQAAHMGELQHALAAGMMGIGEVHAELGELISGRKPGRSSPEEIFVFDSTGTELQDVASAAAGHD